MRALAVRKTGGQWATILLKPCARLSRRERGSSVAERPGQCPQIARGELYLRRDRSTSLAGIVACAAACTGTPPAPGRWRPAGGNSAAAAEEFPLNGGRVYELPRKPEEVRRAEATFKTTACSVKTEGASIEVTYPALSMGIFSGDLRFTMYRGSNLLQMDALASTNEKWVAYLYSAGLKGFSTTTAPAITWHDTGGHMQRYRFGGPVSSGLASVKAANRMMVAEGKGASLAVFTSPHAFFFSREKDTNLGYVYYRKDGDTTYSIGIRMPEGEEPTLGPRLTDNPDQYADNFALYNAPPGTKQKMTVFFMAAPDTAEATRAQAMALTHGDQFKAVPGDKTFVNHFHLAFTDCTRGALDTPLQDLMAM